MSERDCEILRLIDEGTADTAGAASGREPVQRRLLDTLRRAGLRVLVARDADSALEQAQQVMPDVILLDLTMPGADGQETRRRLERDPRTAQAPVIFLTALQAGDGHGDGQDDPLSLHELERRHFISVLRRTHGVIEGPRGAARLLNLKPSTTRFRMKKLGIRREQFLG